MILLIIAIWLLAVVFIHPQGNFPLSDDWAYGGAVKSLLDTGSIKLPDWSSPNFIAQMFWGALFCLPTGFSFTALRVSTLVLGLLGVLITYGLLLEIGAARGLALFGALSLALNPLYLELSHTFMTDIPFVTVSLLSLYFLVRALRTNSNKEVVLGLTFACGAILIRQIGISIFIAAGLAYLVKNRLRVRTVLIAIVPVFLGLITQFVFQEWLKLTHRTPVVYQVQMRLLFNTCTHLSWRSIILAVDALFVFLIYLGLFSLPLLLFLVPRGMMNIFRSRYLTLVTFLFATSTMYFVRNKKMPLLPDVIYDFGLGRPILYDTDTLHLHHLPTAGDKFWIVITILGVVAAAVLFQATVIAITKVCSPRRLSPARRGVMVLLLATEVMYVAPLIILWFDGFVFDRYLLLLVPLSTIVLTQSLPKPEFAKTSFQYNLPAVLSLLLCGVFSVAATHDYLSWNRVRWQALNELMSDQHVNPKQIDGGFEFNAWYLYNRNYPNQLLLYVDQLTQNGESTKSGVGSQSTPKKSWWWVSSDDFVVTLGPVPGFAEVKHYHFPRWLPPGEGNVLTLRRSSTDTPR
jgi:hypothetical protein